MRGIIDGIKTEEGAYKFDEDEEATLEAAGFLHDIGHSPFSHAIEQVLMALKEPSHDEKSLEYLETLESKIKKIPNINFSLLTEIFERKNPLHHLVWDLVGADVLDYIPRDASECGINVSSDADAIATHAYFDGEKYGIDKKTKVFVRQHLQSWLFMNSEVYLRKGTTLLKGLLRTGFYELIKNEKITPEEVWLMTDDQLLGRMEHGQGLSRENYYRIKNREMPKTFLTLKISGQESQEEIRGKPIFVRGLPEEDFMKIMKHFGNIENVMNFERSLEEKFGYKKGAITVAEMPHIEWIQPQNIPLHDTGVGWTSLYNVLPHCSDMFFYEARRIYAFRINIRPEFRKSAYDNAPEILDMLMSLS
jgi:HD superfamily phosphohydrolase